MKIAEALRIFFLMADRRWVKISALLATPLFIFYFLFLNFTEPTDLGIARNIITGTMWEQESGGWHFTAPWVFVPVIDTRPMRVAVTSTGHGYSAKLVQFERRYWREFVSIEGFRYYWWANRLSYNFGYDEEYRGFKDIMRGYAFSAKKYPFIKVITEYSE